MEQILDQIKEEYEKFIAEAEKNLNGNKAAGTRARKSGQNLRNLFKGYRVESIEANKK